MKLAHGLRLSVLAGRTLPVPLTLELTERVREISVTESDEERSAFTIVLDADGVPPGMDTPFGAASPFSAFSRISIIVTFRGLPQVLMDGIVTETALEPGAGGRGARWLITGDDLGNLLDRTERQVEHPGLDDEPVVHTILAPYAASGLSARVTPPATKDTPLATDRIPTQQGTDLTHLVALAQRHGFVAYAAPGSVAGSSFFYWGPPVRLGAPQPALAIDMGHDSNVEDVSFRTEAMTPQTVSGNVMDRRTGAQSPVAAPAPTRPPIAARPFAGANTGEIASRRLRNGGGSTVVAQARAQSQVDQAADNVSAQGTADGARYGAVLRARRLVGLRGAGSAHDGLWYAKKVEHTLTMGAYQVAFTLTRDGHGATTPVLPRAAS